MGERARALATLLAAAALSLGAAAEDAAGGALLANKCCAAAAQLHQSLSSCVPLDSAEGAAEEEETAEAARERAGDGGLPPWMHQRTAVLDPASLAPLSSARFLGGARAGAVLRYGRRPCAFADAQHLYATSRDRYRLLANGTLLLAAWSTNGTGRAPAEVALPPADWCSDRTATGKFVFLLCPCARITCVRRCCSKSSMLVAGKERKVIKGGCSKVEDASQLLVTPQFFSGTRPLGARNASGDEAHNYTGPEVDESLVYTELPSHSPECDKAAYGKYLLNSNPEAARLGFWIQRNGSVLIEDYGRGRAFPPASFCLARVRAADGAVAADVVFCHKRSLSEAPDRENIYYSLLFLSGAFFLLLTLLVHAAVPELRRSAHAKALMCHCASLLVASVTLTVGHLRRRFDEPYCSISAFVVQFFFLSTFFWLNVMCFDLSWSFGAMRRRAPGAGGQRARFLLYSLYAWGCPALVVGATLVVEYADVLPPDLALLPNIGARRCWFDTVTSTLVFYYVPMALLLVANLVLFTFTVSRIRSARKGTSILWKGREHSRVSSAPGGGAQASSGSAASGRRTAGAAGAAGRGGATRHERQMLLVFTKLFCLMGGTWVTEIISWATGDGTVAFWYITDAINLLRGVLIFVLFCCKPAALRQLRARLRAWAACCCPWALRCCAARRPSAATAKGTSSNTQDSTLSLPEATAAAPQRGAAPANHQQRPPAAAPPSHEQLRPAAAPPGHEQLRPAAAPPSHEQLRPAAAPPGHEQLHAQADAAARVEEDAV